MAATTLFGRELAAHLNNCFDPVLVLISPPRSGSTAVARTFWQHPAFRWYVHEPFDRVYHQGGDEQSVLAALDNPLDVGGDRNGLVLKEMSFQAGRHARTLADAANLPVVITVRDPRLAVESRMRQRRRSGQEPSFPPRESGWPDLAVFLEWLRTNRKRYVILDTSRLRATPERTLGALCEFLGLTFTPDMLCWPDAGETRLGQLADEQAHWYERVLRSTGLEPPVERLPELTEFPPELRTHVEEWLEFYRSLTDDGEALT